MKRRLIVAAGILMAGILTACGKQAVQTAAQAAMPPGASLVLDAAGITSGEKEEPKKITVGADHGVTVVPDTAQINFGVMTNARTAKEAQEKNTEDVNNVIAKLKELGVDEKDIRTTGYDMYPRYDNYGQTITGYNMHTNLSVSNQSIENAGMIVTECVAAGINSMNGITYTYSGYNEAYAEALGNATKAAQIKAEAIAAASGKTLGEILSVQEGYQDVSLRNSYQNINYALAAPAAEEAMKDSAMILPGEVNVRAQVTVTYEMQ
ncbi:MAG: SIMPL domain-containing protein [Lachnospiraceae bacterium]|nr:SIMPL domain-containing protein [Lachnospiraceae bacterium]